MKSKHFLKPKSKIAKIAVIFSLILMLASIINVTSDSFAVEGSCMSCNSTEGCHTTTTGFNGCSDVWDLGQVNECNLSGGLCGV